MVLEQESGHNKNYTGNRGARGRGGNRGMMQGRGGRGGNMMARGGMRGKCVVGEIFWKCRPDQGVLLPRLPVARAPRTAVRGYWWCFITGTLYAPSVKV